MLLIHAVQKLLNTSGIKASLHVGAPSEGQQLYSWYAALASTGLPGKLLVLYVHEPSLLTVVCQGKTIKGTIEEFRTRLPLLLRRHGVPEGFIQRELELMDAYEVSKTDSKRMLGIINALKEVVREVVYATPASGPIDRDRLEDILIKYPNWEVRGKSLTSALEYLRKGM
jgi:hypothetical protein